MVVYIFSVAAFGYLRFCFGFQSGHTVRLSYLFISKHERKTLKCKTKKGERSEHESIKESEKHISSNSKSNLDEEKKTIDALFNNNNNNS